MAILDGNGFLVTAYTGTIQFSSSDSDPQATPSFNYSFQPADAGEHTFDLTLLTGGQQTLTFRVSGSDLSGMAYVDVVPVVTLSGPDEVEAGSTVTFTVSTTPLGNATPTGFTVDWDDGTTTTYEGLPATVTHTYTDGPDYFLISGVATFVTPSHSSPPPSSSDSLSTETEIDLFVDEPTVGEQQGANVVPGQTVTLDIPGETGISGVLTHYTGLPKITFYLALYKTAPVSGNTDAVAFYDGRVTTAGPADALTITFRFRPDSGTFSLLVYDPASRTFVPLRGSTEYPNSLIINGAAGYAIVILDDTSNPKLQSLNGTIFSVSLSPAATGQVGASGSAANVTISPSLALGNSSVSTGSFAQQVGFQTATQVTLALSPSQDVAAVGQLVGAQRGRRPVAGGSGPADRTIPPAVQRAADPGPQDHPEIATRNDRAGRCHGRAAGHT